MYALYSATRISSAAGRLAFWAIIFVHCVLLVPSIFVVTQEHMSSEAVVELLARLDIMLGLLVPGFIAWRQHVGDRKLAAQRL